MACLSLAAAPASPHHVPTCLAPALHTSTAMSQKYIHSTCFTSWVTSNANPCPMTTTQDSLYFLSIVSLTSRAAACAQRARHDTPFAPRTALSDIVPSLGGAGCITS